MVKKEELDIEKVKRKNEVEERLKVLNDKKHGLVQLLKQVISLLNSLQSHFVNEKLTRITNFIRN